MYVIAFYPEFGSRMYFYKNVGLKSKFCFCKGSARHYKTKSGALHALINLADSIGEPYNKFDVIYCSDIF